MPEVETPVLIAPADDVDPEITEWLDERVHAFVLAATRHADVCSIAVLARGDGDRIVGGVHGYTWGGCCELISLWVEPDHRGRGVGRRLLRAAETHAEARGCTQVLLFTHDVLSPGMYLRTGYEVVGRVDDYPQGSAALWFRKLLDVPRSEEAELCASVDRVSTAGDAERAIDAAQM
jgi:ribosomal protein S18 acetylase RimI-like enzyme